MRRRLKNWKKGRHQEAKEDVQRPVMRHERAHRIAGCTTKKKLFFQKLKSDIRITIARIVKRIAEPIAPVIWL